MLPTLKTLKKITCLITVVCVFSLRELHAQFTISETFTGTVVTPDIILGDTAFLTAERGIDPPGQGWLRLTDDQPNQLGYAYLNQRFPSSLGVLIDFEYSDWSSELPDGDGFSVFLFDASYGPGTFKLGPSGAALGYAEVDANSKPPAAYTMGPGLTGGYFGVGFDELGNFAAQLNTVDNSAPGARANAITLRGAYKRSHPLPYGN
ncbi:hypothetical protein QTN47_11790 [Danxiaibacter flavus]|uniref:PEP-CTERM sorting domain-containing protein n=1 Tax=Danxiaibacter flavus TaxID=3049108 RepID=A0ABV3ZED7_9BACT|nr:hypothetical protein QNM32_11795 [Chitinophagaceae bacterium DXS]